MKFLYDKGILFFTEFWLMLVYLRKRIPFFTLLLPLIISFFGSFFIYKNLVYEVNISAVGTVLFFVVFLLLLMHLRLVDDLDDISEEKLSVIRAESKKKKIKYSLGLIIFVINILNFYQGFISLYVNLALCIMYVGPFVFKRHFKVSPLLLLVAFVFFEGGPLLIFLFPFVVISAVEPQQDFVGLLSCLSVALGNFIAYLFWKFTRKLNTQEFQPYFLNSKGCTYIAIMLIAISCSLFYVSVFLLEKRIAIFYIYILISLVMVGGLYFRLFIHREAPPRWAGANYLWVYQGFIFYMLIF